jgi:hypothetical protein
MNHLSDDELLELALLRGEPDAPKNGHVETCRDCAVRWRAVLREQDLIRRAFEAPAVEKALPARRRRNDIGRIAAALLFGVVGGLAVSKASTPPRRTSPLRFEEAHTALRRIPAEIESLRSADPARLVSEFPRVISRAEELYGEVLESYLDEAAPLSEVQRSRVRQAVETMYLHAWTDEEPDKVIGEFRDSLRTSLNPEQFAALGALLARHRDSDWDAEIDIITEDVAAALNLRYSEEERVREALRSRYPKSELPTLSLAQWPPDRLAGDPALSAAVRGSLGNGYHAEFDKYVETLRGGRRLAERAAKGFASGQGR